jgi:hypothetical protein
MLNFIFDKKNDSYIRVSEHEHKSREGDIGVVKNKDVERWV